MGLAAILTVVVKDVFKVVLTICLAIALKDGDKGYKNVYKGR